LSGKKEQAVKALQGCYKEDTGDWTEGQERLFRKEEE
jgi:hypothetical protein